VDGGKRAMRLLPSLLQARASEVAAFRAQMRERFTAPPGTCSASVRWIRRAFHEMADKIIAYLSPPIPSAPDPPYCVGSCKSCGNDDCFAIAGLWAAPSIYIDGKAYITGGLCCAACRLGCDRRLRSPDGWE
jgi:hypothetical protein